MKIAYFDCSPRDYTVESVGFKPMGGSESALCYVSRELVHRGHEVHFINWTTTPGLKCGVHCHRLDGLTEEVLAGIQFAVFLNYPDVITRIKPLLDQQTKLVFWTQHAHDQDMIMSLKDVATRSACDRIVFVSDWQRDEYVKAFDIDRNRTHVLRNAISPPFQNLFDLSGEILPKKENPPIMVYTSTPFRGLSVLLDVFPLIRQQVPLVRLQVFSSMKVYGLSDDQDVEFDDLYKRCKQTEGIDYFGSVLQSELAQKLKKATLLAYPNTFAETSCISVMEAMAAGLFVVSSDLGALSETGQGFARLIPTGNTIKKYAENFVSEVVDVLKQVLNPSTQKEQDTFIRKQVAHVNEHATWKVRAKEWESFFQGLSV